MTRKFWLGGSRDELCPPTTTPPQPSHGAVRGTLIGSRHDRSFGPGHAQISADSDGYHRADMRRYDAGLVHGAAGQCQEK